MATVDVGPDLVIAGAARSGTSFLAALLGRHPRVDPCAVKEPNYFSREHGRGPEWYDGLFGPRRPGLLRLDASTSYTFPHFPLALGRLAAESPGAVVVYCVRDPLARLVSHFQLHRDYFHNEHARTLGEALETELGRETVYRGASDYAMWLPRLAELFGPERLLVLPFPVLTERTAEALGAVAARSGLDPGPLTSERPDAGRHQNQVVELRNQGVRVGRRLVRRSGLYPTVRRVLGPDGLRRVRGWATRPVRTESVAEALASCEAGTRRGLVALGETAGSAVADFLADQDARLGVSWSVDWQLERAFPGVGGVGGP